MLLLHEMLHSIPFYSPNQPTIYFAAASLFSFSSRTELVACGLLLVKLVGRVQERDLRSLLYRERKKE
jgi:hypothetical protein